MNSRIFKVALIQLTVTEDRDKNVQRACNFVKEAKKNGARLVALPECFNSAYTLESVKRYAEQIPNGYTSNMLSKCAKENQVYIFGGTISEVENSKYYNTSTVWNPKGELIAKYRKIHPFDMDMPGRGTFKESDVFTPGENLVTFDLDKMTKIGICICYDMRFEELAKFYRIEGCEVLIIPGAFDMHFGAMHWKLLQRSRALDNQMFVFTISPSTNKNGYIAWGHSQVTGPWGEVLAEAGHNEEIVYCNIDLSQCDEARKQIPIYGQRRTDLYSLRGHP